MGAVFVIGIIVLLVLFISLASGAGWFAYQNKKKGDSTVIYPFSATVGPDGQAESFTAIDPNTGATVNQITCPIGTSVNIIGAIAQVTDPYGMCLAGQGQTNPQLQGSALAVTCGLTGNNIIPVPVQSSTACSTDSDCNNPQNPPYPTAAMQCASGRCQIAEFKCKGKECSNNEVCQGASGLGNYQCVDTETGGICTSETRTGMCLETNICFSSTYPGNSSTGMTLDSSMMNPNGNWMCAPGGGGLCAVRDISAYVAQQCDGQQTCNPSIGSLGPFPCALTPVNCNFNLNSPQDYSTERMMSNNGYCALPFAYGNGPTVNAGNQALPNAASPTASLGYTYHGIFTCM